MAVVGPPRASSLYRCLCVSLRCRPFCYQVESDRYNSSLVAPYLPETILLHDDTLAKTRTACDPSPSTESPPWYCRRVASERLPLSETSAESALTQTRPLTSSPPRSSPVSPTPTAPQQATHTPSSGPPNHAAKQPAPRTIPPPHLSHNETAT